MADEYLNNKYIRIEFVLWLAYIVPGVIYSIWRRGGEPSICPNCKKETLKPYDAKNEEKVNQSEETVDCEWCAEPIKPKAKLCKHCKKDVTPSLVQPVMETVELPRENLKVQGSDEINDGPSPIVIFGGGFILLCALLPTLMKIFLEKPNQQKANVSDSFICKSVMAKVFGYMPEKMGSVQHGSRYTITWTSPSDGVNWGTHCWVQNNNRIMWKTDGRNNTNGRLRNGEYDEDITYSINGKKLTIYEVYSDGSKSEEVYKVPASEIVSN